MTSTALLIVFRITVSAALLLALIGVVSFVCVLCIRRCAPSGDQIVPIAGAKISYFQLGAATTFRGTVVLIHGASGSKADLALPLAEGLATRGFRVLAFDRPGLGWSERPPSLSLRDQTSLLQQAAAALGVDKAIVVGHSLGGALAARMAVDHPDFVSGLVLLSAVTHPWPGGIAWYYRVCATPVLGWWFTRLIAPALGLAVISSALRGVFAPRPVPKNYAQRTAARLILTPRRFRANALDVSSLLNFASELAPRLPTIAAPTAIITGDEDSVVSPSIHSASSAREIPGATLTILKGVGHCPHWALPDEVVAEVDQIQRRIRSNIQASVDAGIDPQSTAEATQ